MTVYKYVSDGTLENLHKVKCIQLPRACCDIIIMYFPTTVSGFPVIPFSFNFNCAVPKQPHFMNIKHFISSLRDVNCIRCIVATCGKARHINVLIILSVTSAKWDDVTFTYYYYILLQHLIWQYKWLNSFIKSPGNCFTLW